jgi:hypothetical protein
MTGKALTIFYRRMRYFIFPKWCVALIAECGHLGDQFPALSAQYRVDRIFLIVTRQTLLCLYRGMMLLIIENRLVTGGGRTGLRKGVALEENDQE